MIMHTDAQWRIAFHDSTADELKSAICGPFELVVFYFKYFFFRGYFSVHLVFDISFNTIVVI